MQCRLQIKNIMKYTKAVQCDWCGSVELSINNDGFKKWFKFLGWLQIVNGNGTTNEFCTQECYDLHKKDIVNECKNSHCI